LGDGKVKHVCMYVCVFIPKTKLRKEKLVEPATMYIKLRKAMLVFEPRPSGHGR